MVSQTTLTLTVIFGYAAAFWCLDALSEAGKILTPRSGGFLCLAAGALLAAVLATFGLTSLLLFAHVRALSGAARRRSPDRLTKATLAATAATLLAGAVLRLGAHGYLGSTDDIGWLWIGME